MGAATSGACYIRCGVRDLERSAPDMAPLLPIRCTTPDVAVAISGACHIRCGARDLERSAAVWDFQNAMMGVA